MPITQERFMNVIAGAKVAIRTNRMLRTALEQGLVIEFTEANTVIDHTQDVNARQTIISLLNRITRIRGIFLEYRDDDTDELYGILLAEELHFQRTGKKNQRAAYKQRQARLERGAVPRAQAEIVRSATRIDPRGPSVHITEPKLDAEQTPEYKRITEEIRNKYWPDASPQGPNSEPPGGQARQGQDTQDAPIGDEAPITTLEETAPITAQVHETLSANRITKDTHTVAEVIIAEQQEAKELFGQLDWDTRCKQELEIMRAKQKAIDAVRQGGASYAPGVLRTSVPPASEMLEADVTEGKDVL